MLSFSKVFSSWSQTIRDKEFVVEMRLRNLDPESEKDKDKQVPELPAELPQQVQFLG